MYGVGFNWTLFLTWFQAFDPDGDDINYDVSVFQYADHFSMSYLENGDGLLNLISKYASKEVEFRY